MPGLEPGASLTKTFHVREEHLADRMGSGSVPVLATPALALYMESVAFELAEQALPEGVTSVGVSLDIRHVAPVAAEEEVRVTARLLARDKRRLVFWVEAWQGERLVGYGLHERVIVDREEFLAKTRG